VGTTWQLEARLNASDKTNEQADAFGLRLAFNGTTVVIVQPWLRAAGLEEFLYLKSQRQSGSI